MALVSMVLAGCLGGDEKAPRDPITIPKEQRKEDEVVYKDADLTSLEVDLGAIQVVPDNHPQFNRPNVTRDDWLLLSTNLTEEGTVSAFKWNISKDALIDDPTSESRQLVLLDFAVALDPMGMSAGLPEDVQWLLLIYVERFDTQFKTWKLETPRMYYSHTIHEVTMKTNSEPVSSVTPPQSRPFAVQIPYEPELYGETVHFVLAARGTSGDAFGMGVRMLSERHLGERSPTPDWREFSLATDEEAPHVPERTGNAEGLFMAMRDEITLPGFEHTVRHSPDLPDVDEAVPQDNQPIPTPIREVTIETQVDWAGWSWGEFNYVGGVDQGLWEFTADCHGTSVEKAVNYIAYHSLLPEGTILAGESTSVRYELEGDAGCSNTNHLTKSPSVRTEQLQYRHLSIGAKISELLDTEAVWQQILVE